MDWLLGPRGSDNMINGDLSACPIEEQVQTHALTVLGSALTLNPSM